MKFSANKIIGSLYLLIGIFLLFIYTGIFYISDYLYPSLFFILVGYFSSVFFFNKNRLPGLILSSSLFFAGIPLLIDSLFRITNYNNFITASFFFAIVAILLLLFIYSNNKIYLLISLLIAIIGYYFSFAIPTRYLQTFVLSIDNLLSFSPFVFLFCGFVLFKK